MNKDYFVAVVHRHQLWLSGRPGGKRAHFIGEDFSEIKVVAGSLRRAIFKNCCFDNANLIRIDFSGADLTESTFYQSNLYDCDLSNAVLTNTSFLFTVFNKRAPTLDKTIIKLGGVSAEIGKGISKINCLKKQNSFWLLAPDSKIAETGMDLVWWNQNKSLLHLAMLLKDSEN